MYVLYLQDVARRKKERNSKHHTVSKTAKSCSSFLLTNKQPLDHLNSEAIRNSANFWDTATVISAMYVGAKFDTSTWLSIAYRDFFAHLSPLTSLTSRLHFASRLATHLLSGRRCHLIPGSLSSLLRTFFSLRHFLHLVYVQHRWSADCFACLHHQKLCCKGKIVA